MAYSKAYNLVIAGRTREDELGFFKLNQVASPARVFASVSHSSSKQPTASYDYFNDTAVGKKSAYRHPVTSCYIPNKYGNS